VLAAVTFLSGFGLCLILSLSSGGVTGRISVEIERHDRYMCHIARLEIDFSSRAAILLPGVSICIALFGIEEQLFFKVLLIWISILRYLQ
jgi:hypothetical protein